MDWSLSNSKKADQDLRQQRNLINRSFFQFSDDDSSLGSKDSSSDKSKVDDAGVDEEPISFFRVVLNNFDYCAKDDKNEAKMQETSSESSVEEAVITATTSGIEYFRSSALLTNENTRNPAMHPLTSVVCLSVLDSCEGTSKCSIPSSERIVRESLKLHLKFHFAGNEEETKYLACNGEELRCCPQTNGKNNSHSSSSSWFFSSAGNGSMWSPFRRSTPKVDDIENIRKRIQINPIYLYTERMAEHFLQLHEYSKAMDIYQTLLENLPMEDAAMATTRSKILALGLLSTTARDSKAFQYNIKMLQLHLKNSRKIPAAYLVELGLVYFAAKRNDQALKMWRRALKTNSDNDDILVSILLNNIGVLHYDSGDWPCSMCAFEKSMHLQRHIIRILPAESISEAAPRKSNVEYLLHQLAVTLGNLAMVCEHAGEYGRCIALLQESLCLQESAGAQTAEIQTNISQTLLRVVNKVKNMNNEIHYDSKANEVFEQETPSFTPLDKPQNIDMSIDTYDDDNSICPDTSSTMCGCGV